MTKGIADGEKTTDKRNSVPHGRTYVIQVAGPLGASRELHNASFWVLLGKPHRYSHHTEVVVAELHLSRGHVARHVQQPHVVTW